MSELALCAEALTKRFGDVVAVDGIDLAVPTGTVFGFLGPNGSGKTTTIRILLGLAKATSGRAELLGYDVRTDLAKALPQIGTLVEGPAPYPYLSGRANLGYFDATERGDRAGRAGRVETALARVGLLEAADRRAGTYSLGMRQRLGLAMALLHPRRLLVLDEPTNGLDPSGTKEIRDLVRGLAAEGCTVFLSSHLLSEVDQICTHAAVLGRGRVLAQGTLNELRGVLPTRLRIVADNPSRAAQLLSGVEGLDAVAVEGGVVTVKLGTASPATCNRLLVSAGVDVSELSMSRTGLEDVFLSLTEKGPDVR